MGIIIDAVRDIFQVFRELVWYIVCTIYIVLWGINQERRRAIKLTAVILLSSSIAFVFEAVTMLFKDRISEIPLPRWLKVAIVILALVMVRHRWKEMRSHERAAIFAIQLANLFDAMAGLKLVTGAKADRKKNLDDFITMVLIAFVKVFESPSRWEWRRKRAEPKMSLMLADNEALQIFYHYPLGDHYDIELRLKPGVGCAGIAFQQKKAVYIPAVKYKQGIIITTPSEYLAGKKYSMAKRAYFPAKLQPFKCILSVPVRTKQLPDDAVRGVLNLDSTKQNAFGDFDFDMSYVAANAIGMALDIYESVP
jgi:hypothetical protein